MRKFLSKFMVPVVGAILFACLGSSKATAQTYGQVDGFCEQGGQTVTTSGLVSTTKTQRSYPGCTITVYVAGTATPATLYSDQLGTPMANPFTANATTGYWQFFASPQSVDIQLSGAGLTTYTRGGIVIATGTGGGGGGGVSGTGTVDTLPRWSTTTALGDSIISQDSGATQATVTGNFKATGTAALASGTRSDQRILDGTKTFTGGTAPFYGSNIGITLNGFGTGNVSYGQFTSLTTAGSGDHTGGLYGFEARLQHGGTGTVTIGYGGKFRVANTSSGTLTPVGVLSEVALTSITGSEATAFLANGTQTSGVRSSWYDFRSKGPATGGGATISNFYSFRADAPPSVATDIGAWYSFYSEGGTVSVGPNNSGRIELRAAAPLRFYDGATGNYVQFNQASPPASSYRIELPTDLPAVGEVLQIAATSGPDGYTTQWVPGGGITGSGTADRLTYWTGTSTVGAVTANADYFSLSSGILNLKGVREAENAIQDWGAVADGVTDDTTALQNCIDASAGVRALPCYIPHGQYLVTGLTLSTGAAIIGDGKLETAIISTTNSPIISVPSAAQGASIRRIGLRGSKTAGTSQVGLSLGGSSEYSGVIVEDVRIEETGAAGLLVTKAFSSSFRDIFLDDTAGFPLDYNAPIAPSNTFSNIYVGVVNTTATVGYRIRSGDFTCIECNGVNSSPAGGSWAAVGTKNGVDGDTADAGANFTCIHCNLESFNTYGVLVYSYSQINLLDHTTIAGNAAGTEKAIYFDNTGDGATGCTPSPTCEYYSQLIGRGYIDDTVNISDGYAAYANSQPIHTAKGMPAIQIMGQGPKVAGGVTLASYYNDTTTTTEKLTRADGKASRQALSSTTTIANPGVKYIEADSTGGTFTITIPWGGWYQNGQEPLIIKDVGGAAATNNITLQAGSGADIGPSTTFTMDQNSQTVILMPTGDTGTGAWRIIYDSANAGHPVVDTTNIVKGSADGTKQIRFEVDGLTTATTRVLTPPDANITLAGQNYANSFTALNTFNIGATPAESAVVTINALGAPGTRDSGWLILEGQSYNASPAVVDWKHFVDVTSNLGASKYSIDTRIGAAGYANVYTLSDAGEVETYHIKTFGRTLTTQATGTTGGANFQAALTKNDTNTRTFYGVLIDPEINTGVSNTNTTFDILAVDTVNTATTGVTTNLLNLMYGSSSVFNFNSAGFVDIATSSSPANPSAGYFRIYGNSGTGLVACLDSAGADCMPTGGGSAALTATYVGYGDGANLLTGEAALNYNDTTNTLDVDHVTIVQSGTGTVPFTLQAVAASSAELAQIKDSGGNVRGGWSTAGAFFFRGFSSAPTASLANDAKLFYDITGGVTTQQLLLSKNTGTYNPIVTANQATYTALKIPLWSSTSWELTDSMMTQASGSAGITATQGIVAGGTPTLLTLTGAAHTASVVDTELTDVNMNLNRLVQFDATGHTSHPTQRAVRIQTPSYRATAAYTIGQAIGLDIDTPKASTNMTLTSSYGVRIVPAAAGHHGLKIDMITSATGNAIEFAASGSNLGKFVAVTDRINWVLGGPSIGTTDTDGFVWIPEVAGTPTGVPTSYSNTVPLVYDSTNDLLYAYNAGWQQIGGGGGGTPGGASGTVQWNNGGAFAGLANSVATTNGEITFASSARSSGSSHYFKIITPADTALTASTESIGIHLGGDGSGATQIRTFATGNITKQREVVIPSPTYKHAGFSQISEATTLEIGQPLAFDSNTSFPGQRWAVKIVSGALYVNGNGDNAAHMDIAIGAQNSGLFKYSTLSTGGWAMGANGLPALGFNGSTGHAIMVSNKQLAWASATDFTSPDVGLIRQAAGVLRVTNSGTSEGKLVVGAATVPSTTYSLIVAPEAALTNTEHTAFDLIGNTTTSGASLLAGYGIKARFGLKSSTTDNRDAAEIGVFWSDVTDATRTSVMAFRLVNNAGAIAELARFQAGNFQLGGGTTASELRFLEPSGSGTNYAAFKAPALAGDLTWTLPTTDSTGTQCLASNGSGTLSWSACSGGGGSPGGASGTIQWNNASSFDGIAGSAVDANGAIVLDPTDRTSGVASYLTIKTPADTGQTASTESVGIYFGGDGAGSTVTRTWATGALATQREYVFVAPTYDFAAASTLSTAVTLEVPAAPVAGTNATITETLAFRVASGRSDFPLGTVGATSVPTLTFTSSTTGITARGTTVLNFILNSKNTLELGTTAVRYASDVIMSWSNLAGRADGTADTGLARAAAGVMRVSNGSTSAGKVVVGPSTASTSAADLYVVGSSASLVPLRVDSAASPSVDVFQVSADNGSTTHFKVTSTGAPSAPGTGAGTERFGAGSETGSNINNTVIGSGAGKSGMTGQGLTIVGAAAGDAITSASYSTLIGWSAGGTATSLTYSTVVGYNAMNGAAATGTENAVFGNNSGSVQTSGSYNTFLGTATGDDITTGSYNTFLGNRAGDTTTNAITGSIAIGRKAQPTANNQGVIGGNDGNGHINDLYIGSGVTYATPVNIAINASGGSGTDITGANLTLAGGKGTGAGLGGHVVIQTAPAGTTGTSLNALATIAEFTDDGNILLGGRATATELRFLEPSGSGVNYAAFKAPALVGDLTWTLPTTDSTGTQCLSSNGSGILGWSACSGGSTPPFVDTTSIAEGSGDNTKEVRFELDTLVTTGTVRVWTVPDTDLIVAGIDVANAWADGVKQTFNPNGTTAGLNIGSQAGDPTGLANGDIWYNSTTNKFRCRENATTVDCIGGGSSGLTVGTTTITSGTAGAILYEDASNLLGEIPGSSVATTGAVTFNVSNADTTGYTDIFNLNHDTSGTPGVGFGTGIRFGLESTTTVGRDAGGLRYEWVTATDATRESQMEIDLATTGGASHTALRISQYSAGAGAIIATPTGGSAARLVLRSTGAPIHILPNYINMGAGNSIAFWNSNTLSGDPTMVMYQKRLGINVGPSDTLADGTLEVQSDAADEIAFVAASAVSPSVDIAKFRNNTTDVVQIGGNGEYTQTVIARTSGGAGYFTLTNAADTGLTATGESVGVGFDLSANRTWAAGNIATQREFLVQAPTYTITGGGSTITTAATMAISGAPVQGASTTITNAYALWIQGGDFRHDGTTLSSSQATYNLLNSTTTTINFGGAATTMNLGGSGAAINLGGGAAAAELRFLEPSGGGSSYLAFKSPALAANVTWTLPTTDSTGSQCLQSNGAGTLSWTSCGGGSGLTVGTTTITSGVAGRILYEDASNLLGEIVGSSVTAQGAVTFAPTARSSGTASYFAVANPDDTGITANSESAGMVFDLSGTRTWDAGTVASQREVRFLAPTYAGTTATATFTTAATVAISGAPTQGTNASITTGYALWVESGDALFAGVIKAGSTPVTLTDAAGKILSAALNTVAVGQGGTGLTAGTSGGIPYFDSTSTMASSGALAANTIVMGGGAGAAPTTGGGFTVVTAGSAGTGPANQGTSTALARSDHDHRDVVTLTWYFPGTPSTGVKPMTLTFPDGSSNWSILDMRVTVNTTSASSSSVNIQRCTAGCTGTTPTFGDIYSTDLSLSANTRTVAKGSAPDQNVSGLAAGDQFKANIVTVGSGLADVTVTMTYKKNTVN